MEAERGVPGRGRLPAGLLGMFVLVASIEAGLSGHELDVVTPEDWQYLQAGRDAAERVRGCDLLILGDSLAKFGVLPRVVGKRSKSRAHSLAIGGGQAPSSYELLRLAFQSGARPSAIVVDFSPYLMALPPAHRPVNTCPSCWATARRCDWRGVARSRLAREPRASPHVFLAALPDEPAVVGPLFTPGTTEPLPIGDAPDAGPLGRNAGAMVMPAVPGRTVVGALQQRPILPRGMDSRLRQRRLHARLIELARCPWHEVSTG